MLTYERRETVELFKGLVIDTVGAVVSAGLGAGAGAGAGAGTGTGVGVGAGAGAGMGVGELDIGPM